MKSLAWMLIAIGYLLTAVPCWLEASGWKGVEYACRGVAPFSLGLIIVGMYIIWKKCG